VIQLDAAEVRPGGVLKGSASWDDPPGGRARATLWLVWRTEVRLDQIPRSEGTIRAPGDYCLVAQQSLEVGGRPVPFEFAIPNEGPITYQGQLMRVIWELVAGTQKGASLKVNERAVFKVTTSATAT
jgi:hypothetical protein